MAYEYRISTPAVHDIEKAYRWYEKEQLGLGESFLESLDEAEQIIIANPTVFRFWLKNKVRGYKLRRFPFVILYAVDSRNIDVLAVFHTSRHPDRWKTRQR